MSVRQLSVFIENSPGSLRELAKLLYENGINIRALTVADTDDFGILRIITDDQTKAGKVLSDAEYIVTVTDVIVVAMDDTPGSLFKVLSTLAENNIVIEYTYAFLSNKAPVESAVVLRVDDKEKAEKVLTENGANLMDAGIFG